MGTVGALLPGNRLSRLQWAVTEKAALSVPFVSAGDVLAHVGSFPVERLWLRLGYLLCHLMIQPSSASTLGTETVRSYALSGEAVRRILAAEKL